MPENTSQQSNRSAATLAFATMLSEKLLKEQNSVEGVEETEEVVEEPVVLEEESLELDEPVEEVTEEVEEPEEPPFVADLRSMITEGFENLKGLFKSEPKEV